MFTFLAVMIRGRGLRPLADALNADNCTFVQQFDGAQWAEPEAWATVVDAIEFVTERPRGVAVNHSRSKEEAK